VTDGTPCLTDSEEEKEKDGFTSHHAAGSDSQNVLVSPPTLGVDENPGFGNMIKKFWSKYIYNGFVDIYNKGKGVISGDENEELGNRMYEEYPEFHHEIDLMKDIASSERSDPELNFGMEIDGLERLC
jgi:hypothetical protein